MFVADAANREVMEYDGGTGAILRWYAYGPGANDVVNRTDVASSTRTAYVPDIQGSIVATLSSTSTALTPANYLPYGANANAPDTFAYTGQRIDPESGLYYYRARHYAPLLGRFLQPDPIRYRGGINLYAYVGNDPLNATDPMGLFTWQQGLQVAGGVFETATGVGIAVFTSETVVGAVGGVAIAAHGIDQIQAGWRGVDTVTSQGLPATWLSQNTANAIDIGIGGVSGIVAGSPLLSYEAMTGRAGISGGGQGTSLLSATARGYVIPGVEITGTVAEDSSAIWQGLESYYGTTSMGELWEELLRMRRLQRVSG